ncbi:MAG: hypothetical protein MI864_04565, partial [Pseudomonadales bacterium]|nr:hypothetical protein [Pseudomonadales bacterium]
MKSVNQRARYSLQIAAALLIVCVCGVSYIFLSMSWDDGGRNSAPVITSAELPVAGAESATGQVSGNSNVPDVNAKRVDQNQSIPEAVEWQAESYAAVLAGTEIDGQLQVDSAGNLILDLSVKDFFDYFLSAVGEVSAADAILEIQKQAQARVPDKAVQQVMQLLESYVAYQHALQEIMDQSLRPPEEQNYAYFAETMEKTFEHIKRLRREYMSPEAADAFFRLEEAYAEFAVESMKVRAKDHLTPEEQAIQIRALEAKMPDNMQSAQAAARESA